jgi:hypothetical protein
MSVAIVFSVASLHANEAKKDSRSNNCRLISEELNSRLETISKIKSSLETLLGNSSSFEMPIEVVFQVNLNSPEKIEKRIRELSKSIDAESIYSSIKTSLNASCAYSEVKDIILDYINEQAQINEKKIYFLKIDAEKRNALLNAYQANRNKTSDQFDIENQLSSSKNALNDAQKKLSDSDGKAANLDKGQSEAIFIAQSSLDKFNVDIETEHVTFVEGLKTKGLALEKLQSDLAEFSKKLGTEFDSRGVSDNFTVVSNIWSLAADGILELYRDIKLESEFQIPELGLDIPVSANSDSLDYKKYAEFYLNSQIRQRLLSQIRTKMLDDLKIRDFKILSDSGSLRAKLLQKCDLIDCDRPRGLNEQNIQNIFREIQVVPLKFVASGLSKWIEVKSKISSGAEGWTDLGKQILLLFALFLIPYFLIKILDWISASLELTKKNLLSRSMIDYRSRTGIAVWISRLNPFIPSIGMILSIGIARLLIGKTDLSDFAVVLFYFQIFFVYKSAKLLLAIVFEIVFSTGSVNLVRSQKQKIAKTSTFVSTVIFVEYVLLHITEDSVRRALAYQLFASSIFWLNLLFVLYETSNWRAEIKDAFYFRYNKIWNLVERFYNSKLGIFIVPAMFISIVLHIFYRLVSSYLIRIDFVKRLLSEVLRKRLESAEKDSLVRNTPPKEYLKEFDYYLSAQEEIFIEREESPILTTTKTVENWLNNVPSDDLVILVGNRGMGKTTTLSHIHKRIEKKCHAILTSVPPKIIDESSLYNWLSERLSTKISAIDDIRNFDLNLSQKIVLCVDDIQNLFLGAIGCLNTYRLFLEIISLKTTNIYWCLTINSRSWSYLKGIFGAEHFYGRVLTLSAWRDYEIQNLILTRHKQTNFKRSFDDSIKAYGAGDSLGQQAEAQFFRLLWGQSRGNPRSALMYWISAINSPGHNEIHVGVPSFVSSNTVGAMSDDAHFILASIARHESLTHEELKLVTGIDDSVIRKCLKEANEKELIWIDGSSRARVSSRAQYVIDYFLIGKNFLYE